MFKLTITNLKVKWTHTHKNTILKLRQGISYLYVILDFRCIALVKLRRTQVYK